MPLEKAQRVVNLIKNLKTLSFMEKENDKMVEIGEEDVVEQDFAPEILEANTTDWKAEALKLKGIAKRRATKLEKLKANQVKPKVEELKPQDKIENKKSDELDYAQKAYLKASGINSEEFDFVHQVMKETGKDLDSVLGSKYFQAELKERRDAKAINDAMPKNIPGRSTEPASNKVEYWVNKGELPPDTPENRKLREDITNARYDLEKSRGNSPR